MIAEGQGNLSFLRRHSLLLLGKALLLSKHELCQTKKVKGYNGLRGWRTVELVIRPTSATRELGISTACCKCDIAAQH
jgi:hypothetical protein